MLNPQLDLIYESVRENWPSDNTAADLAKDYGLKRVRAHCDEDWYKAAIHVVRDLCFTENDFTTDDVWIRMPAKHQTHDHRAMGAVMRDASKRGWCRKTDRVVKSKRRECHRRPITVWEPAMLCPF